MQNREHRQGLIVRRCTRTAPTVRKLRLKNLCRTYPAVKYSLSKYAAFPPLHKAASDKGGGYTEADISASFLEKRSFLLPQEPSALIGKKRGLFFVFDDAAADEVVLAADSQEQGKDAFSAGDDRNFTA